LKKGKMERIMNIEYRQMVERKFEYQNERWEILNIEGEKIFE
jgi:hypothetical protein